MRLQCESENEKIFTAGDEEVLGVFEKSIVQQEEEIDGQRRPLDIIWKPDRQAHRTGM